MIASIHTQVYCSRFCTSNNSSQTDRVQQIRHTTLSKKERPCCYYSVYAATDLPALGNALGHCGLDLVHDGRFRKRAQISKLITFARDDLAHDTAHNLARARLGKIVDDVNLLRGREGADSFANLEHEFLVQTHLIVIFELAMARIQQSDG